MVKTNIVIGSAFGDEGKGLMTDYFAHKSSSLDTPYLRSVLGIRFNGGAQAGHTVVVDGKRHIFQHFSAGTFRGCDTLLTNNFIVNPIMFRSELETLKALGINPSVYIGRRTRITTIYDMLYNQYCERLKGENKHGSCGLGINATVTRYTKMSFSHLEHLIPDKFFEHVGQYYHECGFTIKEIQTIAPGFDPTHMSKLFEEDMRYLRSYSKLARENLTFFNEYHDIVLEGAQGLMLDEVYGEFPHVTRSRTGLFNIIPNIKDLHRNQVEIVYCTRAYATRHGAGPFWDDPETVHQYFDVKDPTNIPNDWQGSLRLGVLDFKRNFSFIWQDLRDLNTGCKMHSQIHSNFDSAKISLAITCLGQAKTEKIPIINDSNNIELVDKSNLPAILNETAKGIFNKFYLVEDHGKVREIDVEGGFAD